MSKLRSVRRKQFTQVDNAFLRNNDLSLESRGLLTICLSYSENWNFTLKELAKVAKKGRDTIGKYMNELIDAGYVYRERKRNEKGHLSISDYVFSDDKEDIKYFIENEIKPVSEIPTLDSENGEKPMSEIPTLEKPTLENPTTIKEHSKEEKEKEEKVKKINKKDFSIFEFPNASQFVNDMKNGVTGFESTPDKMHKCYEFLLRSSFNENEAAQMVQNSAIHEQFWKWKYNLYSMNTSFDSMDKEHRKFSFIKWLKERDLVK